MLLTMNKITTQLSALFFTAFTLTFGTVVAQDLKPCSTTEMMKKYFDEHPSLKAQYLAEQKAAEQERVNAQKKPVSQHAGTSVPQEGKPTVKSVHRAAEQGDASAQNSLGSMYSSGQGVAQDYREAAKWYHKAAEQGYAMAQYNLGAMYETAHGVMRNYQEAAKWYRKIGRAHV